MFGDYNMIDRAMLLPIIMIMLLPLFAASGMPEPDNAGKNANDGGAVPRENLMAVMIHRKGSQMLPASTSLLLDRLGGNVFDFGKESLTRDPYLRNGKRKEKYDDFVKSLVDEKTGDILYESADGGYFVVPSGKILDMGAHYLSEFYGLRTWSLPNKDVVGTNDKGFGGKGLLAKPQLGHCYVLLTSKGEDVLFRVIALSENAVRIQWIFNSRHMAVGEIAKLKEAPIPPNDEPVPFVPESLLLDDEILKNIGKHQEYRLLLTKKLIAVAKNDKLTNAPRADAVACLGEMRAKEAVDDLISMITFRSAKKSLEFLEDNLVAVDALVKTGKPSSAAAVKAIGALGVVGLDDFEDSTRHRYLTMLVKRVEGPAIAKILLEDAMAEELKLAGNNPKEDDPHKIAADNLKKAIELLAKMSSY